MKKEKTPRPELSESGDSTNLAPFISVQSDVKITHLYEFAEFKIIDVRE